LSFVRLELVIFTGPTVRSAGPSGYRAGAVPGSPLR
jgi:hypothetical protein